MQVDDTKLTVGVSADPAATRINPLSFVPMSVTP
jgi:hypothetical protein